MAPFFSGEFRAQQVTDSQNQYVAYTNLHGVAE